MTAWLKRGELQLKNSRFFAFRRGAKRVFYPGCSLPGADPEFCLRVYRELRQTDPDLGIWFDCCAKPLRMKGLRHAAERAERKLVDKLLASGVEEVITACGNCQLQFDAIAAGHLRTTFLYDQLKTPALTDPGRERVVHHPCFARQRSDLQQSALRLVDELGLTLQNRRQSGHPLPCCLHRGEPARQRRRKLQQEQVLTYCAHCTLSFQRDIPTRHLLQEIFGSTARWTPRGKIGLFANYRRFCRLLGQNPVGESGR